MAILTDDELVDIRVGVEDEEVINTIKAQINLAIQAIEDTYESTCRSAFSTAIDNATTYAFTNPQKKRIGKYWMRHKFNLGG